MKYILKILTSIGFALIINLFFFIPAQANWVQVVPSTYTVTDGIGYITGNYVSLSGYKDQPRSGITMTFSNGANTYVWPWFDDSPLLGSFFSGGTVTPGSNYYLTATGPVYGFAGPFTVGDSELPQSPSVTCSGATNTLTVTLYLGATDNIGVTAYYAVESPTAPATPSGTGGGWTAVTPSTNYAGSHSFIATKNAGSKTVHVWFKDAANNVSTRASATFTITDTAAPTGSFTISQPAGSVPGFLNSANIGISLTASDVVSDTTHFYIRNENSSQPASSDSNWRAFSASPPGQSASQSVTYSLTGVDGAKNVYVWYKDAAGNIGAASGSPQNLTLDTKVPIAGREGTNVWEYVGNPGFSTGQINRISMTFDSMGNPYVAFVDNAYGNKISVMKFSNGNWSHIGSPGFSAYSDFFDLSIIFYNSNLLVSSVPYNQGKVIIDSFTTIWSNFYTSPFGWAGYQGRMVVSQSDLFLLHHAGAPGPLQVHKYYNGSWLTVGSEQFSVKWSSDMADIEGWNNFIFIALVSGSTGKVSVYKFDNLNPTSWNLLGQSDFSDGVFDANCQLCLEVNKNNGDVYVGYNSNTANGLKTTVKKYNNVSNTWQNVGQPEFSEQNAYNFSLAVNNGIPYAAYRDGAAPSGLSVLKYNTGNNKWEYIQKRWITSSYVQLVTLGFSYNTPYVAFQDSSNSHKISCMKLSETINDGLIINNGAKLTTVRTLKMQIFGTDWQSGIQGTGIEKYSIRCNNSTAPAAGDSAAWLSMPAGFDNAAPATKEVNFTLPTAEPDGLKIFYLWFKDKAGNISSAAQKSIKLDTHPPVEPIAGSIAIAGAHPELQVTREVMLLLNAESGQDGTEGYYDIKVTHYLVKDNNLGASVSAPTAASTDWIAVSTPVTPYADTVPYTITSSGDGTKEIRAWYKDIAGNMSDSSECETYLDTSIPHGSFTINSGAEWSNSPLVTLNLNALSATAVSGYFISTSSSTPAASDAGWRPVSPPTANYIANVPYSLDRSAGVKTVYVWFKSTSGIVSTVSSDTIKLDCEAPEPGYDLPGNWVNVGQPGFSAANILSVSLYVYNGLPFVAFGDYNQSQKATVMKFDGTNWVNIGNPGFSASTAHYVSLFIYNDVPYVSYQDYNSTANVRVMKFDGTNWSNVGVPITGGIGMNHFTPLSIYNGMPFVVYEDTNYSGGKASSRKFDGTSWLNVGSAGFSPGIVDYCSMQVYNGTPFVAFQDYANGMKATVMKFDGINWVNVGNPGFSAGAAYFISLFIYNGTPYVAYQDGGNNSKATVMKFNGISWENVGATGFTPQTVYYTSLSVYNGTPYIAYRDLASNRFRASAMKFDGTTWDYVGTPEFSVAQVDKTTLSIHNGTLYVAFEDANAGHKATVMKYEVKRGPGLDINNGDPYTNSNSIKLNLAGSDNYSGITEYCVSESPAPPNASTTWNLITFPAGGTTEVFYSLSTVTKPVTVYVWYRDAAGNISSYSSAIANPRSMKAVESYGNSSTFNKPFLIAKDSEENLLVADKPAAGISPVFILSKSATPPYSSGTRIISAGAGIDQLKETVSGLVVFSGNLIGLIENAKKRFAVFKAYSIFVNGFAKSVDIIANYHGAGTLNSARALVSDKYTGGLNPVAEARIMANQTPAIPLDLNFAAAAIEIFTDAAYSTPAGPAVSSKSTLYIRVRGAGGDPNAVNSVMVKAKSSDDPKGIAVQLIETSTSSDIFTGTLALGQHTDLAAGALGAGPGTIIYLGVYSKTGILNRAVRTKPKPPSGPVFIADLGSGAGGSIFIEMVRIPAGKFVMGQSGITDAIPTHEVTISKDFYMSRYEITQGQWLNVMGALASADKPLVSQSNTYIYGKGENYPVYYVSWNDICNSGGNDFLTKLNAMELVDGTFRLPTEAEWEYACRAGTTSTYYWGEDASEATIKQYCWYGPNAYSSFPWTVPHAAVQGIQMIGQKLPNAFGLYDMSGNVWEWCCDWYGVYDNAAVTDPTGPSTGSGPVLRGGYWSNDNTYCRSACRGNSGSPSHNGCDFGFRLVLPAGQ